MYKRKYLSFHTKLLEDSFLGFIAFFQDAFVVIRDDFVSTNDIFSREVSKNFTQSESKVLKVNDVVSFFLRISSNNVYCVEIHKVIALSQDISLLRDMVTAFEKNQLRICEASNEDDINEIYYDIFELALLNNIESSNLKLTKRVLFSLKKWSSMTYEGSKVDFCIGVCNAGEVNNQTSICSYLQSKYSATVSNSSETMIVVNRYGEIIDYVHKNDSSCNESLDCPSFCKSIISAALEREELHFSSFLILTKNGDICFLNKKGTLKGLFRSSRWQLISPETFIYHCYRALFKTGINNTFAKDMHKNPFLKKIFALTIDLSLLYCGGIVSFVKNRQLFIEQEKIKKCDNLLECEEPNNKKIMQLKMLKNNNMDAFLQTNNNVLLELLAMDGASCIDFETKRFIVSGFILDQIEPIEGHGGRGAAAFHLSNYGLSIKVSEDGGITLYNDSKKIYEIK